MLDDVGVYATAADARGRAGDGIEAAAGATLMVVASVIQGSAGTGILVDGDGTTVALDQTAVVDSLDAGVWAQDGASVTVVDSTLQRNATSGVEAMNAGTHVDLEATAVLDSGSVGVGVQDGAEVSTTGCTVGPNASRGYAVQDGGHLIATGGTVQGNIEAGVYAAGGGTTVELTHTEVVDNLPGPDGASGRGICVQDGAVLSAAGSAVRRNTGVGVLAAGAGTRVDLVDTLVLDGSPGADREDGWGVDVQGGAALTATGCTVQGNTAAGVVAMDAGTTVDLVDTQVLDTLPGRDGAAGAAGVVATGGASVTATGCLLQANASNGVLADGPGTTVDLTDTQVLETCSDPEGNFGRGIAVQEGAALTSTNDTVQGNTEIGVYASGDGTTVDLAGSSVIGTRKGRNTGLAVGIAVQTGARIHASDSVVSDTSGPGVYVAGGGLAEVDHTELGGNAFAGVLLTDGAAALASCAISDSSPDAEWGGGFGVYVHDRGGRSDLSVEDSTIGPHDYAAIWFDGPGAYDIEGNILSGGEGLEQGSATLHGNAIFAENGVVAWNGATGLRLTDNAFSGATGIAVLLDGSSAGLDGNSWSANGADVRQQACEGAVPLTDAEPDWDPGWAVCPVGNVLVAYDVEFTSLFLRTSETAE